MPVLSLRDHRVARRALWTVSATVSTSTCTNCTASDTSLRGREAHVCPLPDVAYGVACASTGARARPGAVLALCAVCTALTDVPAHHARKESWRSKAVAPKR